MYLCSFNNKAALNKSEVKSGTINYRSISSGHLDMGGIVAVVHGVQGALIARDMESPAK